MSYRPSFVTLCVLSRLSRTWPCLWNDRSLDPIQGPVSAFVACAWTARQCRDILRASVKTRYQILQFVHFAKVNNTFPFIPSCGRFDRTNEACICECHIVKSHVCFFHRTRNSAVASSTSLESGPACWRLCCGVAWSLLVSQVPSDYSTLYRQLDTTSSNFCQPGRRPLCF
jgi:hypothetical protein